MTARQLLRDDVAVIQCFVCGGWGGADQRDRLPCPKYAGTGKLLWDNGRASAYTQENDKAGKRGGRR